MNNPFKTIAISLIPNFTFSDVVRSKLLIFQPWNYQNSDSQNTLKKNLATYLNQKHVELFDSGRTALYFLLQALNIKTGDEVIIQSFTCSVVPASIIWTGAVPIYADIDKTYNLDPEKLSKLITPKTKAVIIQHTFGTPANIDKIVSVCKSKKIILIEDCAHGFGNSYKGQKLGTFGQASFYSFGRDKVISGVWGGAVSINDSQIFENLRKLTSKLPRHTLSWTLKQLIYPPLMFVITKTYSFFKLGKVLHFCFRRLHLLSDAITPQEKQGIKPKTFYQGLPSPLCLLVINQLKKIDAFIQHRQRLAHFYSEKLNTKFDPSSSYLRYSLEIDNPQKIRSKSALKNIFLGDWYTTVIAPKDINLSHFMYQTGSCPQAEAMTQKIINLPTNPNLSLADAQKVVNIIKQWK